MAQHVSAEKRNRQNTKRKARNTALRSKTRGAVKDAQGAVAAKAENRQQTVKEAVSKLNRAVSKKVMSKSTASRQISRLMRSAARA